MGVVVEAVKKFLDALVDEGVMRDVVGPGLQLISAGELAVEEEVGGFKIRAFFSQIFNGVAAVAQDAGVAVDVSDFADARCGVVEGRIVTHHAEIGGIDLDLAEVGGTDGVVRDGDLVGLPSTIVDDGEGLAGRSGALFLSRCRCGEWGVH